VSLVFIFSIFPSLFVIRPDSRLIDLLFDAARFRENWFCAVFISGAVSASEAAAQGFFSGFLATLDGRVIVTSSFRLAYAVRALQQEAVLEALQWS
jgi:hypothetical protein